VQLLDYIAAMERAFGQEARLEMKPILGFAPSTPLETGLARFAAWFKDYYRP
jgi:UDP-glucuronate 4-epimerase